ncbi:unnamed protein product [Penicillium camemberti]|uniref:Str. FM013 n=1 Tax=Penicillium camemberti (strain FM 013) TaxID=1429867 RepID=A0A0G4PNR4_PENC3|nr:unnamed protein product [Penicillium camemberti]
MQGVFLLSLEVRQSAVICHDCEATGAHGTFPTRANVLTGLRGSARHLPEILNLCA